MSSSSCARCDLHVINQALFPRHNPVHEESSNLEVGGAAFLFKTVALLGRKAMRVCGCLLAVIGYFDVRPVVALQSHLCMANSQNKRPKRATADFSGAVGSELATHQRTATAFAAQFVRTNQPRQSENRNGIPMQGQ